MIVIGRTETRPLALAGSLRSCGTGECVLVVGGRADGSGSTFTSAFRMTGTVSNMSVHTWPGAAGTPPLPRDVFAADAVPPHTWFADVGGSQHYSLLSTPQLLVKGDAAVSGATLSSTYPTFAFNGAGALLLRSNPSMSVPFTIAVRTTITSGTSGYVACPVYASPPPPPPS